MTSDSGTLDPLIESALLDRARAYERKAITTWKSGERRKLELLRSETLEILTLLRRLKDNHDHAPDPSS
jgi:hypothetical protein